jgi:hypothetical protein
MLGGIFGRKKDEDGGAPEAVVPAESGSASEPGTAGDADRTWAPGTWNGLDEGSLGEESLFHAGGSGPGDGSSHWDAVRGEVGDRPAPSSASDRPVPAGSSDEAVNTGSLRRPGASRWPDAAGGSGPAGGSSGSGGSGGSRQRPWPGLPTVPTGSIPIIKPASEPAAGQPPASGPDPGRPSAPDPAPASGAGFTPAASPDSSRDPAPVTAPDQPPASAPGFLRPSAPEVPLATPAHSPQPATSGFSPARPADPLSPLSSSPTPAAEPISAPEFPPAVVQEFLRAATAEIPQIPVRDAEPDRAPASAAEFPPASVQEFLRASTAEMPQIPQVPLSDSSQPSAPKSWSGPGAGSAPTIPSRVGGPATEVPPLPAPDVAPLPASEADQAGAAGVPPAPSRGSSWATPADLLNSPSLAAFSAASEPPASPAPDLPRAAEPGPAWATPADLLGVAKTADPLGPDSPSPSSADRPRVSEPGPSWASAADLLAADLLPGAKSAAPPVPESEHLRSDSAQTSASSFEDQTLPSGLPQAPPPAFAPAPTSPPERPGSGTGLPRDPDNEPTRATRERRRAPAADRPSAPDVPPVAGPDFIQVYVSDLPPASGPDAQTDDPPRVSGSDRSQGEAASGPGREFSSADLAPAAAYDDRRVSTSDLPLAPAPDAMGAQTYEYRRFSGSDRPRREAASAPDLPPDPLQSAVYDYLGAPTSDLPLDLSSPPEPDRRRASASTGPQPSVFDLSRAIPSDFPGALGSELLQDPPVDFPPAGPDRSRRPVTEPEPVQTPVYDLSQAPVPDFSRSPGLHLKQDPIAEDYPSAPRSPQAPLYDWPPAPEFQPTADFGQPTEPDRSPQAGAWPGWKIYEQIRAESIGIDPQLQVRCIVGLAQADAPQGVADFTFYGRVVGVEHVECEAEYQLPDGSVATFVPTAHWGYMYRLREVFHLPGSGAWYSIRIRVTAGGQFEADYDYEAEPRFRNSPAPTAEDFRRDTAWFTRDEEHTPFWLRNKLLGS